MTVTIDNVKEYLRIDHAEDDSLLSGMIVAASTYIDGLCLPLDEGETRPAPVDMAIQILTAHFYENRLPTGTQYTGELPFSVSALIAPYRDWEEAVEDDA